jgi:membrane protein implicated in regulation of membrane protease activity
LIEVGAAAFVLLSWGIVAGACVFSVLFRWWAPLVVFVVVMALGLYLLRFFTLPMKRCRKNTVEKPSAECGECAQVVRDDMSSFSI